MFKKPFLFFVCTTLALSALARLPDELDDGKPYKQRRAADLTLPAEITLNLLDNRQQQQRHRDIMPYVEAQKKPYTLKFSEAEVDTLVLKLERIIAALSAERVKNKIQRVVITGKKVRDCFGLTINRNETVRTGQIQYDFADQSAECLTERKANDEYLANETRRLLSRVSNSANQALDQASESSIQNNIKNAYYIPHNRMMMIHYAAAESGLLDSEVLQAIERTLEDHARRRAAQ